MGVSLEEFLSRKGGVGLLVVLVERGKTYSEIESEIDATTDTVSKRRDEALELGLIELQAAKRDTRMLKEHHLTEFGKQITEKMAREGVVTNYLAMRTHQTKLEEGTEDVIDWVQDNADELSKDADESSTTTTDQTTDEDSPSESTKHIVVRPSEDQQKDSAADDVEAGDEATDITQRELDDDDLDPYPSDSDATE